MVRLWDALSGRRIACYQHKSKHAPIAALASTAKHAAIGDTAGGLQLFDLEAGIDGGGVECEVGAVALGGLAAALDRVDGDDPARAADPGQLRDHQADGTEAEDGDAVA